MSRFGVEKAIPAVLSSLQFFEVLVKLLVDRKLLKELPYRLNKGGTASGEKGKELLEVYLVLCE